MKARKLLGCLTIILALSFTTDVSAGSKKGKWKGPKKHKKHRKVPVDGGLGLLALGAAAFGAKRLYDRKTDES